MEKIQPIEPIADVPEIQRGDWYTLPEDDEVSAYLAEALWDGPEPPRGWEFARLSHAAYIYREKSTRWAIVAKFYAVKTSSSAQKHALREKDLTLEAKAILTGAAGYRVVTPLTVWRGILFLEYVDGLTLEDEIAVRRSRPGALSDRLTKVGEFMARLHGHGRPRNPETVSFDSRLTYVHDVVDTLARYGVLQDDPLTRQGLDRLVDRWEGFAPMRQFQPSISHGDATTTNFIYPWEGGLVAIDWERSAPADPAADLGRLKAEVTHSLNEQGGSVAEAIPFLDRLHHAYVRAMPEGQDSEEWDLRVRFYQALSTLRIARNGWISRLNRTALVAQAFSLLSSLN